MCEFKSSIVNFLKHILYTKQKFKKGKNEYNLHYNYPCTTKILKLILLTFCPTSLVI